MFDTTQDITKKGQLSLVLRYVEIQRKENGEPFNFEIKKNFLRFHEVLNHTAKCMTDEVLEILFENLIDIKKVVVRVMIEPVS